MYKNVGEKIKGLAVFFAIIGIAVCIIFGWFCIADEYAPDLGILIIFVGPFLSWISSMGLYGFGQLIEHAESIDKKLGGVTEEDEESDDVDASVEQRYRCFAIERKGIRKHGFCMMCGNLNDDLEKCVVKNKTGEREILACESCIERFLKNSGRR